MIWDRERYIAHALFEDTGREMFCELFGPLHVLEKEWRLQGATEAEIAMRAFDWDYVPVEHVKGWVGAVTGITPRVLEDTPEKIENVEIPLVLQDGQWFLDNFTGG